MNDKLQDERIFTLVFEVNGWGPLYPAKQSSVYASIIMSHVYDSLVTTDNTGSYVPNLAKTWDINSDYTVYTFVINTERKFSDGTKLTAQLYKDSLLQSLQQNAVATNKSALDVMYALKGYEQFKETGDIEGLVVEGDNILRMYFKKPFRAALNQLVGTRYGAYINRNGGYLGTGAYIYKNTTDGFVELEPNPYYTKTPSIKKIRVISASVKDLYDGKVDAALVPFSPSIPVKPLVDIDSIASLLFSHRIFVVNGMEGRVFSNSNLRKALQFILHQNYQNRPEKTKFASYFSYDPQLYQPLFPGRLDDLLVNNIIADGEKYVDELRAVSLKKPISCVSRINNPTGLCEILEENGIKTELHELKFPDIQKAIYHTFKYDLIPFGVTFSSSDPDGIYHLLGKNGAIWNPMISRLETEELIEAGRSITDKLMLNDHYQKVSKSILSNVPFVHMGWQNLRIEYNVKTVEPIDKHMARRHPINVTMLRWR